MSNKEAIGYLEVIKPFLSVYYSKKNYNAINNALEQVLKVLDNLNKIPKKHLKNLNKPILTHSIGNSKIGEDTLCISFNSGLLCHMALLNQCNNCNICYACNQNRTYLKNTVPKNTMNQKTINNVLLGEETLHNVLFETIKDIYCSYSQNKLNNLKFLRFSIEGDILSNEILLIVEKIAKTLKEVFKLIDCYSYTHNKELNLNNAPTIVFNTSDFKNKYYNKETNTIFELNMELLEQIKNEQIVLCNGKCKNCSYCKNKKDTRPIYFLAHGGAFEGVNNLLQYYLSYTKEQDYLIYIIEQQLYSI